jgi:hypothetical protein
MDIAKDLENLGYQIVSDKRADFLTAAEGLGNGIETHVE